VNNFHGLGGFMMHKVIGITMLLCFATIAQVNLSGTVTNAAGGAPIPGVAVALKTLKISGITDIHGQYHIANTTIMVHSTAGIASGSRIVGTHLKLVTATPSPVVVDMFNTAGGKIATLFNKDNLPDGTYDIDLFPAGVAAGVYLIRVRQGNQCVVYRCLPDQSALRGILTNNNIPNSRKGAAKKAEASAAIDTLVFSKTGYSIALLPIQSYVGTIDAVLQSLMAAPAISHITSGNASVTVSWDSVSGATSYNLYYKAGTTVEKESGNKATGVVSPKQITDLANETQYAFAVCAVGAGGESELSAVRTATPSATPVAPRITLQPGSQTATAGESVIFTVTAEGTAPLSYQWYKNGSLISGATSSICTLSNVQAADAGAYGVTVSNGALPNATSNRVFLSVRALATVSDIDGNVYHATTIGTQTWLVENLKTTRFNDGNALQLITDDYAWTVLMTPGYCWMADDSASFKNTY
jgi:hypothetical protein